MAQESVPAAPSLEERRQHINADEKRAAADYFVPWRGGYLTANVITLPHEMLLYRVDNGRLIAEMQEYLQKQSLDWATWREQQEEHATQVKLHEVLLEKARDAAGPIYQELERQAQQIEPLLINGDGIVVNGNRRLAAMRELLRLDPERYGGFREIRAAVLPSDTEPADVEFIEAALQMAPETKLAYGWINRRMKLRRQRDELQLPVEQIAEAYRLEEPVQLDREIAELELVEDYLANYREEPGHYALVADCEALFAGLREQLAALPKNLRSRWRLAGFTLIDGRAAVQGPMDRFFPFAAPIPEAMPNQALRRFAQERAMAVAGEQEEADDAAEAAVDQALNEDLELVFASRQDSERNARLLHTVMDAIRTEHQERQAPARVLARIRKAKEMLSDLMPENLNDKQRRRLRSDLAALQAQASYLLGEGERPREDGLIDKIYRKLRA